MRKEAGEYEPLFRLESWRCIVEKRADGKVETEATIKIWVDGERYVRTAEGNGPVHALDRALRDAIGEIHPHLKDIELVNFKVRILDETKGTDAVTRVLLDASDGHDVVGLDRRQREHHRGVLGGARGLARVRRAAGLATRVARRLIPLAKPVIGAREEELVLEVLRSGQLSLGPRVPAFEQAFAARVGAPHACAVSSRHDRAAPRAARGRRVRGRRGGHVAVLVRRLAPTRCSSSARGRSSPTSTRSRSTSIPRPRAPR